MTGDETERVEVHIGIVGDVDPDIPMHQLDALSDEILHEIKSRLEHTEIEITHSFCTPVPGTEDDRNVE